MTPAAALTCVCIGLVVFNLACMLIRHEQDAWRDRRDSAHWRRFCAACGGVESAHRVLDSAEAIEDPAPDVYMKGNQPPKVVRFVPRIVNRVGHGRAATFTSPPENAA